MPESTQHKLDRVRRPRVQITYDVETLGSIVKTELPFVVGIMADLSGSSLDRAVPNPVALKDRKFVEIDRDNFDTIMEKLKPKVRVDGAALEFSTLDDFSPINVLRNVPELKRLYDSRTRLSNLVAKLDGDVELQKKFVAAYKQLDPDTRAALTNYLDVVNPALNPAARKPSVTNAIGKPGAMSTSAVIISRNEADGDEVTHFKITGITGGELFKKPDGTAPITDDNFIPVAEGEAGLWFKRAAAQGNAATPGKFNVQASVGEGASANVGSDTATAMIIDVGVPTVTGATAAKDALNTDGLVITPTGTDSASVTHFKITGITGGALFKNDGATAINDGGFVTAAEGGAGLKFKPKGASGGKFNVQASLDATDGGLVGDIKTAKITGGQ